jgi:hypothetical protein
MSIAQLSKNEFVRSSGRQDLAEAVAAPGLRETAPPTEHRKWPFSKAVFVAVTSLGYVCAALVFILCSTR